jgi:diguanylate cyclase
MTSPIQSNSLDAKIVAHAEKAWTCMREFKLLPTPENYAVFFAFCEGGDNSLVNEVTEMLAKHAKEPGRLATAVQVIYEKYLAAQSAEAVVSQTATLFDVELRQIMELVQGAQAGADKYGTSLDEFGASLTTAPIEQIKTMVAAMAAETQAMAQQNQQLQDQLSISMSQVNDLKTNLDTVKQESLRDPLTGVGNRKAFTTELVRATNETREQGQTLCIVMVDIDHFKKFNDKYGHLVGDQVLKLVASALKENIKGRDTVARWGGEEFALLLPQTPLDFAVKLADSLRNVMAQKKIIRKPQNEDLGQITLSMGATEYVYGEDINDFVDRADQALYRAKQNGRNRVERGNPPLSLTTLEPKPAAAPEQTVTITVEG